MPLSGRSADSASASGAINLARNLDVRVIATTRSSDKRRVLEALGAEAVIDGPELAPALRARTGGADGVLDLVGVRTLLDSLRIARYGGRRSRTCAWWDHARAKTSGDRVARTRTSA